ncbi:MAG: ABC transporter substrate-binding protein [Bacteroidetes bacterium]|nr:MAG: ABC transporter substrate-binding protein [Bacteroidota bacterium]
MRFFTGICLCLTLFACQPPRTAAPDPSTQSWEQIESAARGQNLTLMMWQGDPFINEYMRSYVAQELKKRYDIELQIAGGQGNVIVSALIAKQEAGSPESELDMVWINGETFFQLRQIQGLYGPFVSQLPNSQYINLKNPFIGMDFQQAIDGYECPWGNVQMALIYDSSRVAVSELPQDTASLARWVAAHPGRFTFSNDFTGLSFLKALFIRMAGGPDSIKGPFRPELYARVAPQLWAYLNRIKPGFWKKGETFPSGLAAVHQMFAAGEIDFTMSMNDTEVDNKIALGLFPNSARAYVWQNGTLRNSHYLGITARSAHKAAAMVAINFLISPEAQLKKSQPAVWGDGTVLSVSDLASPWKEQFAQIPGRRYAPSREGMEPLALPEPAPEYMLRLAEDFRREVIEQ